MNLKYVKKLGFCSMCIVFIFYIVLENVFFLLLLLSDSNIKTFMKIRIQFTFRIYCKINI